MVNWCVSRHRRQQRIVACTKLIFVDMRFSIVLFFPQCAMLFLATVPIRVYCLRVHRNIKLKKGRSIQVWRSAPAPAHLIHSLTHRRRRRRRHHHRCICSFVQCPIVYLIAHFVFLPFYHYYYVLLFLLLSLLILNCYFCEASCEMHLMCIYRVRVEFPFLAKITKS